MKFLLDQFPIIAFFVAYFFPPEGTRAIFFATAVAIPASLLQVTAHRIMYRRFDKGQLVTLGLLVVLGGATLLLQDERYIMWKPTAVYWLFAAVFLGSQFIGARPVAERMMGHVMAAPRRIWLRVNAAWVVFFTVLGFLNLYVAKHYSEAAWVKFKLFGVLGLLLLFALAQTVYLSRHSELKEVPKG
ncbi:MAG: putative intracellular septation protein A [Gammaproteobacteria bacterium]|nr:putative intracellular septation protein A [Gammaproteobacteria bacterium]